MSKKKLLVLLWVLAASKTLTAANKLLIEPQTLTVNDRNAAIPIRLDNDQALYGFSLSLATDVTQLKIVRLDLEGTAAAEAGWSFGQVLEDGARISWGVVLDISAPFDVSKVIPPGEKVHVANLRVDVSATVPATSIVNFQNFGGDPPARNVLVKTDGQTAAFTTQAGEITIQAPPPEQFRRGDADIDTKLALTDAIRILGFLFLGSGELLCLEAADADDSGKINLTDAVSILFFLFQGGPRPASPGPPPGPCGVDPVDSPAKLGCESYNC